MVPLTVVLAVPVHVWTLHWIPVQPPVPGTLGQTPACAPVPQAMPPGQAGQSSAPPQPLPMRPQYWPPPIGLQVIGVQFVAVQTPGTPPPPHVEPAAQSPHVSVPLTCTVGTV